MDTKQSGRKPIDGKQCAQINLTADMVDALDTLAQRTADTRSRLVRQAVAEFLTRREQTPAQA